MLTSLIGKNVDISFGLFGAAEGVVVEVDDHWLKLNHKNKVILIKLTQIHRIVC